MTVTAAGLVHPIHDPVAARGGDRLAAPRSRPVEEAVAALDQPAHRKPTVAERRVEAVEDGEVAGGVHAEDLAAVAS
jgi:hypothetical protein